MSPSTDTLIVSKAFRTLAAEFALAGAELHTEIGLDGATRLHVGSRGKVVKLETLDAARAYLGRIQ
jgi:hypothetical protein